MADLNTDANGNLLLEGLIYRAAKGAVTGRFTGTLEGTTDDLPVVEVNFMFVAGNSGGPVFDAENRRVVAMVEGFQSRRIGEVLMGTAIEQLPFGVGPNYIAPLIAIYSWGIKLDCFRAALEGYGVIP